MGLDKGVDELPPVICPSSLSVKGGSASRDSDVRPEPFPFRWNRTGALDSRRGGNPLLRTTAMPFGPADD